MEPEERLFLNLIGDFTVEDIRYAIGTDLDLAKMVQEELPDFMMAAKDAANAYMRKHPAAKELLNNPMAAAQKVVHTLKVYKPVLGYEIELYKAHPTTSSTGFKVKNPAKGPDLQEGMALLKTEHVGYAWVAKNLVGLSELLLPPGMRFEAKGSV